MSSLPTGAAVAVRQAKEPQKARGFLHIVRHGAATNAFYIVSYHQIARTGVRPKPMLAEGAQALIDMLEKVGVDFRLREVRGALEDILRLGSANIPDLWLSDEELLEKGLVESESVFSLVAATFRWPSCSCLCRGGFTPPSWVAPALVAAAFRGGRLSLVAQPFLAALFALFFSLYGAPLHADCSATKKHKGPEAGASGPLFFRGSLPLTENRASPHAASGDARTDAAQPVLGGISFWASAAAARGATLRRTQGNDQSHSLQPSSNSPSLHIVD
jgi:hypothetical protein